MCLPWLVSDSPAGCSSVVSITFRGRAIWPVAVQKKTIQLYSNLYIPSPSLYVRPALTISHSGIRAPLQLWKMLSRPPFDRRSRRAPWAPSSVLDVALRARAAAAGCCAAPHRAVVCIVCCAAQQLAAVVSRLDCGHNGRRMPASRCRWPAWLTPSWLQPCRSRHQHSIIIDIFSISACERVWRRGDVHLSAMSR